MNLSFFTPDMPTTPSPYRAHKDHMTTLLGSPASTGEQRKKAHRGREAKKSRKEWKRRLLHGLIHTFAFLFLAALVFRAYEQLFHTSIDGYKTSLFNSQLLDWKGSKWWLPDSLHRPASQEKKCVVDVKKKRYVEEEVRKSAIGQICNDPDGFVKDQSTFLKPLTFADFECGLAVAFGKDEKYIIVGGGAITLSKKGLADLKFPMMQRGKWCRYDIWRLKKFKKKMSRK